MAQKKGGTASLTQSVWLKLPVICYSAVPALTDNYPSFCSSLSFHDSSLSIYDMMIRNTYIYNVVEAHGYSFKWQ